MKKTKIIIPSLGLLLLSTAASVTGTVAWFAANASVTATGMQIKAKTNSTFLLIGEEDLTTAAAIQAQSGNDKITEALTVADADAAVLPSKAYGVADTSKDPATTETFSPTAVSTKALAAAPGNWYTASSNDPSLWGGSTQTTNPTVLTSFDDYVIKKSVNLTVAVGSVPANNLTVKPTITIKDTFVKTSDTALAPGKSYYTLGAGDTYGLVETPDVANIATYYEKATDISAVKVLVVSDNNQVAVLSSANNAAAVNLYGATNLNITSSTVHSVDIYIYYDGSEAAVNSNNAANLSGATIDLEFAVSTVAA